jgi:hypothetical protein
MTNKILNEIHRFKSINKYNNYLLTEQEVPTEAPDGALEPEAPVDGAVPPTDASVPPVDGAVPPTDAMASTDSTEEIDITDLVNMTKSLKNDVEKTNMVNTDSISKMDSVFTKLNDLESKLGEMNNIISKIDQLGAKIETMKPVTPQERLEMRSLDSYPFSQTPQQFFDVKKNEMRASGKNEYILTKQDVDNYSKNQIAQSFNPNY